MQCEECMRVPDFNAEACGQCPYFLRMLTSEENPDANGKEDSTGYRTLAQLIGVGTVAAGALAAIAGLPEVAAGLTIFGAGVLLADVTSRDWTD